MRQAVQQRIRFGGTRTPERYFFELTGGRLCLDLANTKDERATDHLRELLPGYGEAVDWAVQAGAVTAVEGRRLRRRSRDEPAAAARARSRLVSARELMFQIFSAAAAGRAVAAPLLAALNALAVKAQAGRRVEIVRGGFQWNWRPTDPPALDRPLLAAALSAVELLTSPDVARVRQCEGDGCAWLFIDTSKNRSRRWCDMTVCGNRAKARRHRARASRASAG